MKKYNGKESGKPGASRPCFRYLEGKGCGFGKNCRYSHDLASAGTHRPRQQTAMTSSNGNAKLKQWRSLLARDRFHHVPLSARLPDFFRLAYELVQDQADASVIQQLVVALATEEGLQRVKELTDTGVPTTRNKKQVWGSQLGLYFSFLSHPLVMESSILENEVAMLFNHLIGVNGERMGRVFDFINALLDETKSDAAYGLRVLEVSSLILHKMVSFNTAATVSESMQRACRDLLDYAKTHGQDVDDYYMRKAREHLQGIARRLDISEGIPFLQGQSRLPQLRARFALHNDLPGSLSSDGCRHSNDHSDITKIRILPPLEEVQSNRTEYRPLLDPSEWHLQGTKGLLDRHFRLIREDTVGQLRDAVRWELEVVSGHRGKNMRNDSGVRIFSYPDACISRIGFDRRSGFTFVVHCRHPQLPKGVNTPAKKGKWWEQSKRMQPGALVCLVDTKSILFCRIHEMPLSQFSSPEEKSATQMDDCRLEVHLQLAEPSKSQVEHEIRHLAWATPPARRSLVEFPGVLLDSFKPVLEALQEQYKSTDISFARILAPAPGSEPPNTAEPPLYTLRPGFTFDLTSICKPGTSMKFSPREVPDVKGLCERTTLDESQARALLNSLRHGLALTQGPPGTGKSYTGECLIKILLKNSEEASLGPILCVCYTNHALDQLLEHLWKSGTKQIVRIGSQSKSEVLEQVNLRVVSRGVGKSRHESKTHGSATGILKDMEKLVPKMLDHLHNSTTPAGVLRYLEEHKPDLFRYFSGGEDEEGFVTVTYSRDSLIQTWLKGGQKRTAKIRPIQSLSTLPPQTLSNPERLALYNEWVREAIDEMVIRTADEYSEYETQTGEIDKVRREVDLRCLRQAKIVGVTTTGLARNLKLLRGLKSKVLLCEEAGEVLEGHLLTALLPSIEHAIFIGDHQQLRPQIQNYDLQSSNPYGEKYSLDMSLFERLVQPLSETDPRVPYDTLQIQRRMHPSISRLIRATLYPSLVDAPSVCQYPPVSGMKRRLFWLDHAHPEFGSDNGAAIDTSHSNDFEVVMTTALVSHLVRQGVYEKDDIAVLTPYLGQLHKLRRQLSKVYEIVLGEQDIADLERHGLEDLDKEEKVVQKNTLNRQLRIATVDNFQGEEAKVVVISLVRSNAQNKCGFLRTSNRINVLLSRAQHGMYIIGNSSTYAHVDMWRAVIGMLKESKDFGAQFQLQCPRHPETEIIASEPDHFAIFSPEGGCSLPCEKRLLCGHRCPSRCHSDALHMAVRCLEPCPRPKEGCEHPCPRLCGDSCEEKCMVVLSGQQLNLGCGHVVSNPTCWQNQYPEKILCATKTKRVVPGCSHQVTVPCHVDVSVVEHQCEAKCSASLDCGHECARLCRICRPKDQNGDLKPANHQTCVVKCGRPYATCRHICQEVCHQGSDCKPCSQQCESRCSHSQCPLKCNEPCAPCAESRCSSCCPHSKCTMPCAAPCDWLPCSRRCTKELPCGHQCPSICGEACPPVQFCQVCCQQPIKSIVVDMLEFKEYGEIDLDEDPCIFPDCGHVKTLSTLDGLMDMSGHYKMTPEGEVTGIIAFAEPLSDQKSETKACPECRGSLRNISRYGRIIRRTLLWESHQKFIGWVNSEHNALWARLLGWEAEYLNDEAYPPALGLFRSGDNINMSGDGGQIINRLRQFVRGKRYGTIGSLWVDIIKYLNRTRKEEQPFQKVFDHVQHSRRQNRTTGAFVFDPAIFQARGAILGLRLQLRCLISMLTDFAGMFDKARDVSSTVIINVKWPLEQCKKFITMSEQRMYPLHQIEGHVYLIRLCSLAMKFVNPKDEAAVPGCSSKEEQNAGSRQKTTAEYLEFANTHVELARKLIQANPSCEVLEPELEAAASAVRRGTFYQQVSNEEREAIAKAMQFEFHGSGHWYQCVNGHPFTIGECGMAMETATCPECGERVGGANHQAVAGVTVDQGMDSLAHGP